MSLELVDKVPANARIIFVGINPAIKSAQVGHYYAHPSNKFWQLLSESGIAPRPVTHVDDDWLTTQGFGFTDVAKRPTVGAGDVTAAEYKLAPARIDDIIAKTQPDVVVFVSKKAARAWLGISDGEAIAYGPSTMVGRTQVWFLPSTSGQSYRDTSYAEKLACFKALAAHVAKPRLIPAASFAPFEVVGIKVPAGYAKRFAGGVKPERLWMTKVEDKSWPGRRFERWSGVDLDNEHAPLHLDVGEDFCYIANNADAPKVAAKLARLWGGEVYRDGARVVA